VEGGFGGGEGWVDCGGGAVVIGGGWEDDGGEGGNGLVDFGFLGGGGWWCEWGCGGRGGDASSTTGVSTIAYGTTSVSSCILVGSTCCTCH